MKIREICKCGHEKEEHGSVGCLGIVYDNNYESEKDQLCDCHTYESVSNNK